ncbi:MAG: hypothetical protein NVS3B16_12960 [Vulcanimicrobiaceae bacterium]
MRRIGEVREQHRKRYRDDRRWQAKTGYRAYGARHAAEAVTDEDGDVAHVRARQRLANRERFGEFAVGQPATLAGEKMLRLSADAAEAAKRQTRESAGEIEPGRPAAQGRRRQNGLSPAT